MFKQKNEKANKPKLFSNLKKPLKSIEEVVGNNQDQLNENGSELGSYSSLKSIKKLRTNNNISDIDLSKSRIYIDIKGSTEEANLNVVNKNGINICEEENKPNTENKSKSLFATREVKSSHISE
jgi:hypothetical protein